MSTYLSANSLTSDYGTVGDYLIEWRLGSVTGTSVFITGEGTDPLIQATHPFTNEVVQSGTLYPTIIYAYFNGTRYDLEYSPENNYSPDLLHCLELYYQVIDSVNCSTGGAGTYSHTYTYNNLLDPAVNASRSIKFDLNSDGTTNFFAWYFQGFEVVDQFTITYYHISDLGNPDILVNWKIGSNLTGNNFTSDPKAYDYSSIHSVIDLQPYSHVSGDYLLINIIPRVDEPSNTNTNWTLSFKCLETFDDNTYEDNMRVMDTSTVSAVWNPSLCTYDFTWKNLVPYVIPTHYENYLDTRWLDSIESPSDLGTWYVKATGTIGISLRNRMDTIKPTINSGNTCYALSGSLNIVKSGSNLIYTFDNSTDYNFYKTSYNNIITNVTWIDQSTDPYDRSYYNYTYVNERIAATCGDSYTSKIGYIWKIQDNTSFNDGLMTITISLTNFTISITEEDCDDLYDEVSVLHSSISNFISSTDFNVTTNVRYLGIVGRYWEDFPSIYSNYSGSIQYYESHSSLIGVTPSGWNTLTGTNYGIDLWNGTVYITDMNDPVNNFQITNILNPDGTYFSPAEVIYQLSNGIRVLPTKSYLSNIVSSGSWVDFTVPKLSSNDTTFAYSYSTSFVTGVVNGFADFDIPIGKSINGIGIILRYGCNTSPGLVTMDCRISKDGGSTWSSYIGEQTNSSFQLLDIEFGGANDLWGTSFTREEIIDTSNFCIEVIGKTNNGTNYIRLDSISAIVYYEL